MRRFLLAALAALGLASASYAQTLVGYSNVTTFSGSGFPNGGATNQAGNTITRLVADDIQTIAAAFGRTTTQFTFSIANFNSVAVTARPRVRFYDNNGTGGGPGTILAGFSFNPISFAVGVQNFNAAAAFTIPLDGSFWAGITFDDNTGATGITPAQLDLLGQGIWNAPTIGSSADTIFITTAAGSFLANNPAGGQNNFGGAPVANFGWAFVVSVPEPSTYALFALGGICCLGAAYWYRRRMISQAETAMARGMRTR